MVPHLFVYGDAASSYSTSLFLWEKCHFSLSGHQRAGIRWLDSILAGNSELKEMTTLCSQAT